MSLAVIGAGLGRTGTASAKIALEQLGLGNCYHMGEVWRHPHHFPLWVEAAAGNRPWEQLFDGYNAAMDYPACSFWRELAEEYPDAKVLLTVRDANRWFDSTQATIMSPAILEWLKASPYRAMFEATVWADFGDRINDRDFMLPYFEQRVEEIKQALPSDRLLVYEVKQGWQPLCDFLDVPIPDGPFPHANSREETARLIEEMISAEPDAPSNDKLKELVAEVFPEQGGN
jgi:hypothetical protein